MRATTQDRGTSCLICPAAVLRSPTRCVWCVTCPSWHTPSRLTVEDAAAGTVHDAVDKKLRHTLRLSGGDEITMVDVVLSQENTSVRVHAHDGYEHIASGRGCVSTRVSRAVASWCDLLY